MRFEAYPKVKRRVEATNLAGHLVVLILKILGSLPTAMLHAGLSKFLPLYPFFRPRHVKRLKECFIESSLPAKISLGRYYQMRLELLLRCVHQHGRPISPSSLEVTGLEHYQRALATDRPVALLGLHTGILELLHRVPEKPEDKPFLILTAPAFAPALTTYMAKGRMQDGKEILWSRSGPSFDPLPGHPFYAGLRAIVKQKGILALMIDQHPEPKFESQAILLWGRIELPYPTRLLKFLMSQNFIFIPVSTRLRPDKKSTFTYHPYWDFRGEERSLSTSKNESDLHRMLKTFLETEISAEPLQWNWSYPRIRVAEKNDRK